MDESITSLIYLATATIIFSIIAACLKKYFNIDITRITNAINQQHNQQTEIEIQQLQLRDRVETCEEILHSANNSENQSANNSESKTSPIL